MPENPCVVNTLKQLALVQLLGFILFCPVCDMKYVSFDATQNKS